VNTVEVDFHVFCACMKTGLTDMYVAPMLSHHSLGVEDREIPSSRRSAWIQKSSAVVLATDLYSAFVEERETVGCFLEFHEIKFEPKKTQ